MRLAEAVLSVYRGEECPFCLMRDEHDSECPVLLALDVLATFA